MTNKHAALAVLFLFALASSVGVFFQKEAYSFPTTDQKAPQEETVTGTALETMNASGYTYINVDTGKEKLWVAIPQSEVKKDDKVTFYQGMVMPEFESKSLKRTFKNIIFSSGLVDPNNTNSNKAENTTTNSPKKSGDSFAEAVKAEGGQIAPPGSAMPQKSGGSAGATAAPVKIKVDKAEGKNSYTVSEIFDKAKDLSGQKVRVKGKVAKYNAGIMGKNWIHIQDGTGDSAAKTHDLVATTKERLASAGDVITIEGVVAADKDFGFGYKYSVIIEEASVIK